MVGEQLDTSDSGCEGSTTTSISSQVLEDVTAREAKRISSFIQKQIRRKEYAERVFLERLKKKEEMRVKLDKLEERVARADALRDRKSCELHEILETRSQMRDELLAVEQRKQLARIEEMKAKLSQQDASLEEFLKQKQDKLSATNELWEAKLREITERAKNNKAEVKRNKEELLAKRTEKVTKVIERKSKYIRMQQLKGEETTLRVLDALDRKRQRDRRIAQKREQIGHLLNQEIEKAHMIELTKEQLLHQRNQLLTLRKKDTVAIEKIPGPGPSDYSTERSDSEEIPGGFISSSKSKLDIPGTVDFESSKQVPGPGYYDSGRPLFETASASVWGTAKKTTFVEEENKSKYDIPGPATYDPPSPRTERGIKTFKRDIFPNRRDKLKTWLVHENRSLIPGPGTYTVDDFTRNEAFRRKFDGGTDYTKRLLLPPVVEEPPQSNDTSVLEI